MAVGKETEKGAGDEGRRSALALYEDIEAEHMAALEATGIAFAPYNSERLEREGLLRQLRERGGSHPQWRSECGHRPHERCLRGVHRLLREPQFCLDEQLPSRLFLLLQSQSGGFCLLVRATFSMASPAGRFGCRARLPGLHCAYWR